MIYLDNSSTTHKKPFSVIYESKKGLTKYSVNSSRSGYQLANKVAMKVFECREILSKFLGTTPDNVIFTSGCTTAINLAIRGTLKKGGHIITTVFEHNSVLRTLEYIKNNYGITYTILTPNKKGQILCSDIEKNIKKNTYLVIINQTSNVTGATQNITAIGKLCKKYNLLFMVDGAQSIGHEEINMEKQNINLLTLAGHKGLYAPQGIGALLLNKIIIKPLIYGGTGTYSDKLSQPTEIPDGLESGTQNIIGILGLLAGTKFVMRNITKINYKINKNTNYLINELNKIKNINIINHNTSSGVISITINSKDSSQISNELDEKYHICTRSGLHCAPLIHKYLGTIKTGTTRISLSYYNNKKEINKLIKALQKIALEV